MKQNIAGYDVKLTDYDKRIFADIEQCITTNNIGQALKYIKGAINEYVNKALLQVTGFQDGMFNTSDKQSKALDKIIQNSLKVSLVTQQLKKLYHL